MTSLLAPADKAALIAQDDVTLAEWYRILNTWGWPEQLPNPEGSEHVRGPSRRRDAMDWIVDMVGERLVSRVWNKKMTDQEFEDFWKATMEKDPAARIRYEEHLKRRVEMDARLRSKEFDGPLV